MKAGNRRIVNLMTDEDVAVWLHQRRLAMGFATIKAMADALGISRKALHDMIAGKRVFGAKNIQRLNAIDPDFELLQLTVVARRKEGKH